MSQQIKIVDGYIYVKLEEAAMISVLEDMNGCADLLAPQIVIEDNYVRFRDQDTKMLDPELFFRKEVPKLKLDDQQWKIILTWIVVSLILMLTTYYLSHGHLDLGNFWIVVLSFVGFIVACQYFYFESLHCERYRKATYVKARLLTFLYMTSLYDMTTTNERLERTTQRHDKDYKYVKQLFQSLMIEQPGNIRSRYVDARFPDGDLILPEHENHRPNKLS